ASPEVIAFAFGSFDNRGMIEVSRFALSCSIAVCLCLQGSVSRAAPPAGVSPPEKNTIEQWDIFELSLPGPSDGNPFADVTLSARFELGETSVVARGFYDGEGTYRI